jgi:hypothetical protein
LSFASAKSDFDHQRLAAESYANSATFGDLLSKMRVQGLSDEQSRSIESLLKAEGVTLDSELVKEKLGDSQISFGNVRLVWNESMEMKTGSGRVLKFDATATPEQVFQKTFQALTEKDHAVMNLMVPKAYAAPKESARSALSAAAWTTGVYAMRAAVTTGAAVFDGLSSVFYGLEWLKTFLANGIHGKIKCGPKGEYILDGEYKYYDKDKVYQQLKRISEASKSDPFRDPNSFVEQTNTAVAERMMNDGVAKTEAIYRMFTLDKNKDIVMSDAFLKKVWQPAAVPKCDMRVSAQVVQGAWRAPGASIDEKVRNFQAKQYGPKYNYDYDDHGQPIIPRAGRSRRAN